MNYQFDVGPTATDLGFFWILAHYFGSFIIGIIVIGFVLLAGWLVYRRFKNERASESLLEKFNRIKKL